MFVRKSTNVAKARKPKPEPKRPGEGCYARESLGIYSKNCTATDR